MIKDVKAQEIVFWDDIPENVVTARHVGLYAELYTTFEEFEMKVEAYLSVR